MQCNMVQVVFISPTVYRYVDQDKPGGTPSTGVIPFGTEPVPPSTSGTGTVPSGTSQYKFVTGR